MLRSVELTSAVVDEWVELGFITRGQGDVLALHAALAPPAQRSRARALAAEGLGYLGGLLSVAAAGAIAATFWPRLDTAAQVALLALVAGLLLAGGAVAGNGSPAMARVASVLWFLSVASGSGAVGVAMTDVHIADDLAYLTVAVSVSLYAAALWVLRPKPLQQIALGGGVANVVGALLALPQHAPAAEWWGLSFAALGCVWLALTWSGVLRPERTGLALGAVGVLAGCQVLVFGSETPGLVAGVVAAVAMLAVGVTARRLVAVGFGGVGMLLFVPQAIQTWLGDALGGALTLLMVGLLMLGAGLVVAKTRSAQ